MGVAISLDISKQPLISFRGATMNFPGTGRYRALQKTFYLSHMKKGLAGKNFGDFSHINS